MVKKTGKGLTSINYVFILFSLMFLNSCAAGSYSANTPRHVTYQYLFPKHTSNYHSGDTITLTWKAVSTQEQTNEANTVILKAEFPQASGIHGDLSKPLIVNTTSWSGKTYTMAFHVPKDMQKLTYKFATSITIKTSTSAQTFQEGVSYITIE